MRAVAQMDRTNGDSLGVHSPDMPRLVEHADKPGTHATYMCTFIDGETETNVKLSSDTQSQVHELCGIQLSGSIVTSLHL